MAVGVFHGNPGQNSFATSELGLPVDGTVQINGTTHLNSIIVFDDNNIVDGYVQSIMLKRNTGPIYDYVLEVYAEGGSDGSCGYLRFWDMTGDYYKLSICAFLPDTHTVRFNSDNPIINRIEWSSCPF
ncbi:MAG: hypothetical protein AB6733_21570 [Clostridiaceae bacterium]